MKWVATYNQERGTYDVTTLEKAAERNYDNVTAGEGKGQLIFGVYDTVQEAQQNCDRVPKKIPAK
jgi:hypothetical protein